jgi:hypothetical protein
MCSADKGEETGVSPGGRPIHRPPSSPPMSKLQKKNHVGTLYTYRRPRNFKKMCKKFLRSSALLRRLSGTRQKPSDKDVDDDDDDD